MADLLDLIPKHGENVLDVGARDGHLSGLLADRFGSVVALDLKLPEVGDARVEAVVGDATALDYEDNAFDTVVCAEVLEHVAESQLERACNELVRVARRTIVIGVPYRQDLRYGQTICRTCNGINPPWGHLNTFDERRLRSLFASVAITRISHVGSSRQRTNSVSAALMQFAGNPYGTYEQDEVCVHCGSKLQGPAARTLVQRIATKVAYKLERVQQAFISPQANWIHLRFDKSDTVGEPR